MLPAEIAQAVKRIQFVTGRQVSDVMAGAYLSVFKGRGMEFDEVRPYVPGDDIRAIDWNVTARTGEPHVKRFVEERELTVMLLVDVSASQDFGSGRRSKLEAAVELSALLAMSAVENGDKVGLLLFHGKDGRIVEGFNPVFNSLSLFRVPQDHSVTQVTSFAPRDRLAISGWFLRAPDESDA